MADRFSKHQRGITSGAVGAMAVTPSDTADLAESIRAVTIGTAGTLSFIGSDGVVCTTAELPVGTYALFARRIMASNTTAAKITGWI